MPRAVVIKPVQEDNLPPPAQPQEEQPAVHRRVYILQKDIAKYGYSATCPGCNALRVGENKRGKRENSQISNATMEAR
eukprot:616082-Pyramimonas_sp.AAC.1